MAGRRYTSPPANSWSLLKLISVIGAVAAAAAAFPAYWTISDHWMNRVEIQKAIKDHKDHDASIQTWNQFGFADTRSQFLADHVFECDTKKMTGGKLTPSDAAICARYELQYKAKQDEAAALKKQALDTTKEKE